MSITYERLSDIATPSGHPTEDLHFGLVLGFAEATGWDLIDEHGDNMGDDSVFVRDTLDGGAEGSRYFNECAGVKKTAVAGFPALICPRLQVRKGDRRSAYSVVDFGDWRMSINDDVSIYIPFRSLTERILTRRSRAAMERVHGGSAWHDKGGV